MPTDRPADAGATAGGPDRLTVAELAGILADDLVGPPLGPSPGEAATDTVDLTLTSISSGQISDGSLFFGLPGRRSDGAAFIEEAFAHGARCAVVGTAPTSAPSRPTLVVADPVAALQRLAAWRRARLGATVVAVAGTFGKTTAKDALAAFLAPTTRVFASPGSFNSQIGVPLALLRCPADAEVAVLELAATEPGEMARLAAMVRPDRAVLTNVLQRQRADFGSLQRQRAELSLVGRHLPPGGWLLTERADQVDGASLAPGTTVHEASAVCAFTETPLRHRLESSNLGLSDFRLGIGGQAAIEVTRTTRERLRSVEIAAAAARLLGCTDLPARYSPSVATVKTWISPGRATIVRFPVSGDRMVWAGQLARVRSMSARHARVVVVVTDPLHGVPAETLRAVLGPAGVMAGPAGVMAGSAGVMAGSAGIGAGSAGIGAGPGPEICATGEAAERLAAAGVAVRAFPTGEALSEHLRSIEIVDSLIAIFGPRSVDIEALSSDYLDVIAPTKLYVSEDAVRSNVGRIRRHLSGRSDIMAVIKGGGYGANPIAMAGILERAGIDHFAVATVDEGVDLRLAGVRRPILALLASPAELGKARRYDLTVALQSEATLRAALELGERSPAVHIDLDTGMRRTGLAVAEVAGVVELLAKAEVAVTGVMTHLASADEPELDDFTLDQLDQFEIGSRRVADLVAAAGGGRVIRHALNTPGSLRFSRFQYDYVRIGIGLLGIGLTLPGDRDGGPSLEPASTLISEIIATRDLRPGDRVGYGCTFTVSEPRRSAVVPIGYYDGLPRAFGPTGSVMVDGVRCPVLGRVNMDSIVIDVTGTEADVGTTVLVFGTYDGWSRPIEEVAEAAGTIPYEILARIGPRVQRIFIEH